MKDLLFFRVFDVSELFLFLAASMPFGGLLCDGLVVWARVRVKGCCMVFRVGVLGAAFV